MSLLHCQRNNETQFYFPEFMWDVAELLETRNIELLHMVLNQWKNVHFFNVDTPRFPKV